MKRPAMYIFLNKELGMSTGKAAAQAAHAAVLAYEGSNWYTPELVDKWNLGGHYTKLVMEAKNEARLRMTQKYLEDRGFKTHLVIDEGLTEIDPHQATALGVEIVDRNDPHVSATFSTFDLYRDQVRLVVEYER